MKAEPLTPAELTAPALDDEAFCARIWMMDTEQLHLLWRWVYALWITKATRELGLRK